MVEERETPMYELSTSSSERGGFFQKKHFIPLGRSRSLVTRGRGYTDEEENKEGKEEDGKEEEEEEEDSHDDQELLLSSYSWRAFGPPEFDNESSVESDRVSEQNVRHERVESNISSRSTVAF